MVSMSYALQSEVTTNEWGEYSSNGKFWQILNATEQSGMQCGVIMHS